MNAVLYDKKQTPYQLVFQRTEKPVPSAGQVLVKIKAVSINAADYRSMRMGLIPARRIFGADIAGQIEAVGPDAARFKVGDEVFGDLSASSFGGFAEYVAASEKALVLKPAAVPFETAAAIPIAGLTALQGLRDLGKIQAGQKVLICGAGGGVGNFAVQLARFFGAQVTALCGPNNVATVSSLGAHRVINYTSGAFTHEDQCYDLILAVNGNYRLAEYRRALTPRGILVMAGGALSQIFAVMGFGWLYSLGGRKMRMLSAKASNDDLAFLIKLVENGKLKTVIDRTYPLDQTPQAMEYAARGHARGKVVIKVQ